ncbi:MAG: deoxyguanosinetriphosphate triphosphohydrolase [Betaproteobacteria bacterium]|jgi:dGTPase|nr:deoxyguanosinetriphosphate triphosphohydrolase [Rhodocyclaceae bacterium]MCA3134041.1 deoxyguanosinetriphosphate triphosphohydrolase [Rhodocyclaceae bacterium]MCA3142667.1 deoxyguanosinetriphosphate triphosphohydrolase [Rhodocyclaceae bacterium]MCA3144416.1 deoxyguanosinetriphosphate triphosphohydrolase [Rhodocyclaceae bacterium]MCE2897480.1 deoxyguanosinetriphosphate triphosphohydrolase [Betaproteobacteria bacterium]
MPELAPYAAQPHASRGRRVPEPPPEGRSEYQRDRDRIVHSAAFRRLEYKTQVFVNHEGDLFRTRLTHSIEVAQIGRSIARVLGLNEDLVEAIALAHDLGHTPFGHAGQDALNECMRDHGGFEHNLQSLRVVDHLESRYGAFDGLNLTFEAREGVLKHCSRRNAEKLGEVGARFLLGLRPGLEAQLANLADEIAYDNHDVDDGIRSGLIHLEALEEVPIFARHLREVRVAFPELRDRRLVHETVRRMINALVTDLTRQTRANIEAARPASIDEVRAAAALAAFSEPLRAEQQALKAFLRHNLYRHYRVVRMTFKSQRIVRELFAAFLSERRLLPPEFQRRGEHDLPRAIADYIAGMTDRYAIREHRRLFLVDDGSGN